MLTIRNEQLQTLSRAARRGFEQRMARHLSRFFPEVAENMDAHELVGLIRYGCARASSHGFRSERDVCKYLDLMAVLGPNFDVDERHAWAAQILAGEDPDRNARMKRMVSAAVEHLSAEMLVGVR